MARTSKSKKFSNKRNQRNQGGKKHTNKTRRHKPKVIYVYPSVNKEQYTQSPQQPLPPPEQPRPGVFTWGDAGKLLAVDVGAIMFSKGLDELTD